MAIYGIILLQFFKIRCQCLLTLNKVLNLSKPWQRHSNGVGSNDGLTIIVFDRSLKSEFNSTLHILINFSVIRRLSLFILIE